MHDCYNHEITRKICRDLRKSKTRISHTGCVIEMTQKELATEFEERYNLKIDPKGNGNRIAKIEQTGNIRADELSAYADFFNTSKEFILGFTTDPSKKPNPTVDAIIKHTGLSAKAIEKIHSFRKEPELINTINLLFEDRCFGMLIGEVISFLNEKDDGLVEIKMKNGHIRGDSYKAIIERSILGNMAKILEDIKENSHPRKQSDCQS